MDNTTVLDNKLIAEFMGGKYDKDTQFPIPPDDIWIPSHGIVKANTIELGKGPIMHYHNSWDWLMPVVDKIEEITLSTEDPVFWFEISIGFITLHSHPQYFGEVPKIDIRVKEENNGKLKAVYIAVYTFIIWYNKQVDG